eukprot:TRINITY_DN79827_c0_g1_i1.p1 TRINITY_DN79827_c0_g1~~TRINITY_DN79827_c0_g1_i1.p1  ORF type:complete len:289 (-),score=48.24 TRINITY_DN79827_c0_g1_i1:367-1233(-)
MDCTSHTRVFHVAAGKGNQLLSIVEGEGGEEQKERLAMSMLPEIAGTTGASTVAYEVQLDPNSSCLLWNSVVVLPNVLTARECSLLVAAADRALARASSGSARKVAKRRAAVERGRSAASSVPSALHRLPICDLGCEAGLLSHSLLEERILPFLAASFPASSILATFGCEALESQHFSFSPHEPAVNVYTPGGDFQRHTDKCSLTVNVLLSKPGTFEGGGTLFWPEPPSGQSFPMAPRSSSATLVCPQQATALLFNGTLEHAGRAVEVGTRYVYVASFDLGNRRGAAN